MGEARIYNLSWDRIPQPRPPRAVAVRHNTATIRWPERIDAVILYPALGTPEIHWGAGNDIELILLTQAGFPLPRMRERILDQLKISFGLHRLKHGAARPLFVGPDGELAGDSPSQRRVEVEQAPFGPRVRLETKSQRFAGYLDPRAFSILQGAGYNTAWRVSISAACLSVATGGDRVCTQLEPHDGIIEEVLDRRHPELAGPGGYHAFVINGADIDFTRHDPESPIQSWHPVFHYDELEFANFGHISDVHIAARQHVLAKTRARVVDYGGGGGELDRDVSPAIGERVNVCSRDMIEVTSQIGAGSSDILLIGGDLVDCLRSCRLTEPMAARIGDGNPAAVWNEVRLGRGYDVNYRDCVDMVGFYGALLWFFRSFKKPAFIVSGNHDCYHLPYGISPRVKIGSYEHRTNAGIPADHNLTIYEAILAFGESYGRKESPGFPFDASMFDWFYSVFTPFDDYAAQLPKQSLLGFGWGSDEVVLQPGGHGIGYLPRSSQGVSSDQVSLLDLAAGTGKKVILMSHFTFVSYDDAIPMQDAWRDGREGDVYFGLLRDYNDCNLGTFEANRALMLGTHCGERRDVQLVLTGHSHRRGLYLVDRVDRSGNDSLKIRYFDFTDFPTIKSRFRDHRFEPAIIVSDSSGSIPRYNLNGEFQGWGSDPPSGTRIEFDRAGRLDHVSAVRAEGCSPRLVVALDYWASVKKTEVITRFQTRRAAAVLAETGRLAAIEFEIELNSSLTVRGFRITGVRMYWRLTTATPWVRVDLHEDSERGCFKLNTDETQMFLSGAALNRQRGNFVALRLNQPPGFSRYNCDDWWIREFQVIENWSNWKEFWKPKEVSYTIECDRARAEKPDFDWRRTFVPEKYA